MTQRSLLLLACFSAAAAWPAILTMLEGALMSPLQRATREVICGSRFHASFELMGHCAACWAGSTLLIATGLIVMASARDRREALRVPAK